MRVMVTITPLTQRLDLAVRNLADFMTHECLEGDPRVNEAGDNESLTVEIDLDGTIVVHGDIDIAGGPTLEAVIMSHETNNPIVIDLDDVSFIDSSGLRSLLGASRRAHARNSTVKLRSVGPEVTRLLQITGTVDQFIIESSRG